MAEFVMERFTYCPGGNPANEVAFEVVIADDDARPITDPTARTTNVVRLFTRGDFAALRGAKRDCLFTTGRTAARTVIASGRATASHCDVDLTALGLTITFPRPRGTPLPFDFYGGPSRGATEPTASTSFDTYKTRSRV